MSTSRCRPRYHPHLRRSARTGFDAFSTYEAVQSWFGPAECSPIAGTVCFRVGGEYRIDMQSLVVIKFRETDDGTEMRFIQSGFPSDESTTGHEHGWCSSFDKLAAR